MPIDKNQSAKAAEPLQKAAPQPSAASTPATPGVTDPNGAMGLMGASAGGEGGHNGAIRGQSVGPSEGIRKFEQSGNAVGGSELAKMIDSIVSALAARSGVPSPNPAPAAPQVGNR